MPVSPESLNCYLVCFMLYKKLGFTAENAEIAEIILH